MHESSRSNPFPDFSRSSQQARDAALLRATTELFTQEVVHDHDEIRRYEELSTHLLPKVPLEDRAYVAERLATRLDAPASLIRTLAKDKIEVARLILARSPALGPLDLLAIIAATGPEHHRLIATRPGLPAEVMRALTITTGEVKPAVKTPVAPPAPSSASLESEPATAAAPAAPAAPSSSAGARTSSGWFSQREAVALRTNRFDPWQFLALDRPRRLRLMAELAMRPPVRRYAGSSDRIDRAFRSILGAAQIVGFARSGQQRALVEAISESLDIDASFVATSLDDASGEPLAVLLKVLGLDNTQAQQVFLLATTAVGVDVTAFFRLCDLYAAMEPVVAETLVESWREPRHPTIPRHEPLFAENGERRRQAASEPSRERTTPAVERPGRAAGK